MNQSCTWKLASELLMPLKNTHIACLPQGADKEWGELKYSSQRQFKAKLFGKRFAPVAEVVREGFMEEGPFLCFFSRGKVKVCGRG